MITGSTLSHQKAQKFLREYHAWGRVYFGGKCKTSDVQKAIGLFKNDHCELPLTEVSGFLRMPLVFGHFRYWSFLLQ